MEDQANFVAAGNLSPEARERILESFGRLTSDARRQGKAAFRRKNPRRHTMNYVKFSFGEEAESQASGCAMRARIALGAAEGGAVIVEVGESGGAAGKGAGAARKEPADDASAELRAGIERLEARQKEAEAQKNELEARKKELEGRKKELEAEVKRLEARRAELRGELRAGARERGIGDEGSLMAPGGRPAEGARRIADGDGKRPGANESIDI